MRAGKGTGIALPAGMDFSLPDFYVPDPILMFVAQGYHHSAERLVELLLEELGIRWLDD